MAIFGECKKYEDSAVEYIYKCKTSPGLLVKILASLRTAKMVLEKVKANLSTLLQRMGRAHFTNRQTASILTMMSSLVTMIESTSVDSLGTNSAFIAMTSSILQLDTSSTEVTSTYRRSTDSATHQQYFGYHYYHHLQAINGYHDAH